MKKNDSFVVSSSELPPSRAVSRRKVGRPVNLEHRAKRREQILAMAVKMFVERGYAETKIQDLADQLKIAKGTVFHYFATKEQLFYDTCEYYCFERLHSRLRRVVLEPEKNPVQTFYIVIRTFIEYFLSHPEVVELMVLERTCFREGPPPKYQKLREEHHKNWVEANQRMIDAQWYRDEMPVENICNVVECLLHGAIFQNHRGGTPSGGAHQETPHEQAETITRILFTGLLHPKHLSQFEAYLAEATSVGKSHGTRSSA